MSRHVMDNSRAPKDGSILKRFAEIEKTGTKAGPHKSTESLQQRPRQRSDGGDGRAKAYLKIDRSAR